MRTIRKSSRGIACVAVLALFTQTAAWAGQKPSPKGKAKSTFRYIGLAAGAVAGVFVGYTISDDDATFAEEKLTRNIIIMSVGLGAAGFLAGYAIDKRSWRHSLVDPVTITEIRLRMIESESRRMRALMKTSQEATAVGASEIALDNRPLESVFP